MTTVLLFDTLKFSKRLMSAGMPQKQAEEFAEAQKEVFQESLSNGLASKDDIWRIEQKLKEFDGKFQLLSWMMGFVLAFLVALTFKIYG